MIRNQPLKGVVAVYPVMVPKIWRDYWSLARAIAGDDEEMVTLYEPGTALSCGDGRIAVDTRKSILICWRLGEHLISGRPVMRSTIMSSPAIPLFIGAFIDGLDVAAAGFKRVKPKMTGRPGYAPGDLLKFSIYGYLNSVRSSFWYWI